VYSSAAAAVAGGGQQLILTGGGPTREAVQEGEGGEVFYDLASLTKPLATTMALLCLLADNRISLTTTLAGLLERDVPADKQAITLEMLLGHRAGLPAWRPYYEELRRHRWPERRHLLERLILSESLVATPGATEIYSDLGFMLLGWIVEKKAAMPLDRLLLERMYAPLGIGEKLFFNRTKPEPDISSPQKGVFQQTVRQGCYVPTENCPWRGRLLTGEVHADNAWTMGGVAGHAGLFGTIEAVLRLTQVLLRAWRGEKGLPGIRSADLRQFLDYGMEEGGRALGFDRPSAENSSTGRFFSRRSVGHLGFTGTSFWIDPEQNLVAVLLTNRVIYGRENGKIKNFRPVFHDLVCRNISGQQASLLRHNETGRRPPGSVEKHLP